MVYAPAERADTLPTFLLYPCMYSVGRQGGEKRGWMGDGDGEEEGLKETGKGGSGEWRRDRES